MINAVKLFLALSTFLCYTEAYPYFHKCSTSSSNVLTTLNGQISGACYNVTVNYGRYIYKNSLNKKFKTKQKVTIL